MIIQAVLHNRSEIVQYLLDNGSQILATTKWRRETWHPVTGAAAWKGHAKTVRLLLNRGWSKILSYSKIGTVATQYVG
jgi:hypothetical protein